MTFPPRTGPFTTVPPTTILNQNLTVAGISFSFQFQCETFFCVHSCLAAIIFSPSPTKDAANDVASDVPYLSVDFFFSKSQDLKFNSVGFFVFSVKSVWGFFVGKLARNNPNNNPHLMFNTYPWPAFEL